VPPVKLIEVDSYPMPTCPKKPSKVDCAIALEPVKENKVATNNFFFIFITFQIFRNTKNFISENNKS
jgi:hypothetical protein